MQFLRDRIFIIFFIVFVFMTVAACQGMTPKQQAAGIMLSYNKAYDDYMLRIQDPNLTAEQKEILAKQRIIMVQLYPKIKLYNQYVETGKLPYRGIEGEINNLLFELEKLVLIQIE